jgi:anti-anti-sigma factor
MKFLDQPPQPFGRVLLDMTLQTKLGLKTPLVFRIIKLLQQHGYVPGYGYQLAEVCLEEAIANAMTHGNALDESKHVRVIVCGDDARFAVLVQDEGAGFDASALPDLNDPQTLLRERGRGFLLIEHYMQDVGYHRDSRRLVMARARQTEPDEGAKPPAPPPLAEAPPEDGVIEPEPLTAPPPRPERLQVVDLPDELELEGADTEPVFEVAGPVAVQQRGSVLVLQIQPRRITEDNAAELRTALLSAIGQADRVVLDLRHVEFMSSVGISTIMLAYRQVHQRKGKMALSGINPAVRNIFSVAGLLRVFKVGQTVDEAVAGL